MTNEEKKSKKLLIPSDIFNVTRCDWPTTVRNYTKIEQFKTFPTGSHARRCIKESLSLCSLNKTYKYTDWIHKIEFIRKDNDLSMLITVCGPSNTPYEGGKIDLLFEFPKNYPFVPFKAWCTSKIYHPLVDLKTKELTKLMPVNKYKVISSHVFFVL